MSNKIWGGQVAGNFLGLRGTRKRVVKLDLQMTLESVKSYLQLVKQILVVMQKCVE